VKAPIRASLSLAVAILIVAAAFPSVTTAWGGKPWNAMHQTIECDLEIDPSVGGSAYGQIECPEQVKTWLDPYHPAMRSDTFVAGGIGVTEVRFSLRPWFAPLGNRHGTMSCEGTWERSTWGGLSVNNEFGVRCRLRGHPDIACVDFLGNSSSATFFDSITVSCSPMEYFDGKEWIYWDIDHGYDASVKVKVLKGGIVRATPVDPQPDFIGTVRFKIQNQASKKVQTQDVMVAAGRATLVLKSPGRYRVTAYFCNSSTCETILYVSERMSVTK